MALGTLERTSTDERVGARPVPPGTSLSGTLVFDVPEDATSGTLSSERSRTAVRLPQEAAGEESADPAPATGTHGSGHG